MTGQPSRDDLIVDLKGAVDETLAYFSGPGSASRARIDRWGTWEVLGHFLYWHNVTAWGIASANLGGPPWQLSGTADETNDAALALHAGESFADLVAQLRQATIRLVRVAGQTTDLEAAAFRFTDGRTISTGQRLETIARHWRSHVQMLRDADG